MIRLLFICGFAVPWVAVAWADPPKEQADTVTIPLDQIWAYHMPGTKDIRDLVATTFQNNANPAVSERESRHLGEKFTHQLFEKLEYLSPKRAKSAASGFVVSGSPTDALVRSHGVIVGGETPLSRLPTNTPLWMVFFAHASGRQVNIDKVTIKSGVIDVSINFVPRKAQYLTPQFALIPIGQLPPAKYQVRIVPNPLSDKFLNAGFEPVADAEIERIICSPFSFEVTEANRE